MLEEGVPFPCILINDWFKNVTAVYTENINRKGFSVRYENQIKISEVNLMLSGSLQQTYCKRKMFLGLVGDALNPSNLEGKGKRISAFQASQVCTVKPCPKL